MKPDGQNIEVTVKRIVDENGKDMDSCPHPKQQLYIDLVLSLTDTIYYVEKRSKDF